MDCKGISKQRLVYTVMCVTTIIIFVITFYYIDFLDLNTFSTKIRRRVVPSGPVIGSTVTQLNAAPIKRESYVNVIGKSTMKTDRLLFSPKTSTRSSLKISTTAAVSTSTKSYATSAVTSHVISKPPSTDAPDANHSLSYPPSFLTPEVLAKLSLAQLREKSLQYDVSKFPVPKIIHQSWKVQKLPPRFEKWSATWKSCFPDWKYRLWTDEDNHAFVKNNFPWFNKRYSSLRSNVQKADAVRYLYLFRFGGIYADLDDECLKPFLNLLKGQPIVFGAMEGAWFGKGSIARLDEGYVQNSFMYSVAGHPFWLDVIETILSKPNSHSAESTTGPFMLQEVIGKWRKRMSKSYHKVTIYGPKYFNPFSWITRKFPTCKDVNGMTSADIKKCKANFPEAYVIQYHTQTWGRGASQTNRNDRRRLRL